MIYFVAGTGTGIGKTTVVGQLGRSLQRLGQPFITAKAVQTGCSGPAEDVAAHRSALGQTWLPQDAAGLTCPYVFPFAGSPHLAADLVGQQIDPHCIQQAMTKLEAENGTVLCEGAGGLLTPLAPGFTQLDLVRQAGWPVILVSTNQLGSLSATLACLEVLRLHQLPLTGVVYNVWAGVDDRITTSTARYLKTQIAPQPFVRAEAQADYRSFFRS